MSAAIICSSCNRPLRVPETVLGQAVQCPLCLDEFVAQADPAAEAAARAAEPPARRAAPKPELVAARGADGDEPPVVAEVVEEEPVWVEPVAEVAPEKKAGRAPAGARSIRFPVLVTRDPDRVLRGRMDAELVENGLHLRKPRQPAAFAAVGRARYLGGNRLAVTVEGRDVELVVEKSWTSTYHLARDVAGFLDGRHAFPDARAYGIPWYLYVLPALFVVLPFAAIPFGLLTDGCLGGFVWCLIAAVLAGVTLLVVVQPRLRPRARLIGAGGLIGLGAAICLIAIPLTPRYTIDPLLWKSYTPPDGGFTVLTPGTPTQTRVGGAFAADKYSTSVESPDVTFTVYAAPEQADNNFGGFQPFNSGPNSTAIHNAQSLLQQEFYLGFQYPQTDRYVSTYSGQPYQEYYYVISNNYGAGTSAGKSLAARVYVVNGMTYTLAVFGPRVRADGADVLKFFSSFKPAPVSTGPKPGLPAGRRPGSPLGMGGLLAYWSFDENLLGARIEDGSGNHLFGTLHNAALIADGPQGQALHLSGPGSYFDFGESNTLNIPAQGDFTFCGWLRTRAASGTVLSNRRDADAAPDIDVKIENGILATDLRPDGNAFVNANTLRGQAAVNDGNWHHFAVSRRCNGPQASYSLFVDGVRRAGQQSFNVGACGPITTDLRALGAEQYWQRHNIGGGTATFVGDVDEFCVFGRALDDGEVRKLAGFGG